MVVPFAASVGIWGDTVSAWGAAGMALVFARIAILGARDAGQGRRVARLRWLLALAFAATGAS